MILHNLIHPINIFLEEVHLPKSLQIDYLDPTRLSKNPWNPNEVDPINQDKIKASLQKIGFFKPILCRELEDGSLEIIGGEHRVEAAIDLEYQTVPVINLGKVSDADAKKMVLLDNGRYGEDNPEKMAELLSDLGSAEELLSILAIDEAQLSSYFEHATFSDDDFDGLFDDEEEKSHKEVDLAPAVSSLQTHAILRFKVRVEDAQMINEILSKIKSTQGFTAGDSMSNDGDALVHLIGGVAN